MKITRHRLYHDDNTPFSFVRSPNFRGDVDHRYLIIHYTASPNAQSAIDTLIDPNVSASAHVVIDRDGAITQLVPFNKVAWHAGYSEWDGLTGLNQYSIGVELVNAGKLKRHGDRWRAWFGAEYDATEVLEDTHKNEASVAGWHLYPTEQIAATLEFSRLLTRKYALLDVLGHDDIAPKRKTDPGPAFPTSSFRAGIFGRHKDAPIVYLTTTGLNIRSGPGAQHPKIIPNGLPAGTRVVILGQQRYWRFVSVLDAIDGDYDLDGWAHGRYLQRIT